MLPRLDYTDTVEPLYQAYLNELASSAFTGELNYQYGARLAVATDNSVYQKLPQAVVYPRTKQDVITIVALCSNTKFSDIKFSARGGGTGTNGQSLTDGIVVDMSKYMNRILAIDVEQGWVKVEAGVVKDQLNDYLRPHGYFFAPDLSTSNRATIGGMINTDASGQGSLVYGKTSDHVLSLQCVLADGSSISTEKMAVEQARNKASQQSTEGLLYQQVLASCEQNRAQILEKFPRLNRFLTGYDLENVFNDELSTFDLGRVITGSEGSLAFVCEAKLNITPISKAKALVIVKYDSFDSALRHSPRLVEAQATSVETIDSRVLNLAKQDIVWHTVSDLITDVDGITTDGINLVEYNGDTLAQLADKIAQLETNLADDIALNKGVIGYQITNELSSINRLYAMRKKAVGLLGNTDGAKKPIAFAEDTAVPPENLADFIAEFRALLDSYQLDYGMFGHVDAGVLHVRPALDMCDPEQEVLLRSISDKVVALTAKYGGLMWGEHGKGYRSEYGPEFFGEQLFTELRKIKSVFDPLNKMNPGKICTPIDSKEVLVSVDDTKRGFYDRQIPIEVKDSFSSVMSCNGNGLCFNYDAESPMCPSSKITKDRRHSPKGRAGLMREWLRLVESKGVDLLALENKVNFWSIKQFVNKFQTVLNKPSVEQDFSHEVMEAMSGCLACKACASQCPIKVDVPDFRARFINIYYSRYFRPIKDHLVANIELMAPLMAKAPSVVNGVIDSKPFKWAERNLLGYVDTPKLSMPTLKQLTGNFKTFDFQSLTQLSPEQKRKHIIVVQDPFTSFYDARTVNALMRFAQHIGFIPILLPFKPNGKPQHVKGFLKRFTKTAKSSAEFLNQVATLDIPLVGVDGSLVLCYRDEYKSVLGANRGDFNVQLSHEWLEQVITNQADVNKDFHHNIDTNFKLFSHCTEKTALPKSEIQWQQIFSFFGLNLAVEKVGCCGMAGTYGHEKANLENSKGLYQLSWQDKIDVRFAEQYLVTGFSCRSQVKRIDGIQTKHPVEALADLFE